MANPKLEILKAAVRKLAQEAEFTAKKQAADRAAKPIRNVSARDAAEVAREARRPVGGMSPIGRSRGSGNIPTRAPNWAENRNLNKVIVRQTEKKKAEDLAKEKAGQAAAKKRQLEFQLKNPPASKAGLKGVKAPKPSTKPGLTEYERNMRPKNGQPVEPGEGLKARAAADRREAIEAAQKEQEGRLEYQRQLRDSKINPNRTKSPAAREDVMQREADRRANQGLREISAQEKKNAAARTTSGITGPGAARVNKLYRNRGD